MYYTDIEDFIRGSIELFAVTSFFLSYMIQGISFFKAQIVPNKISVQSKTLSFISQLLEGCLLNTTIVVTDFTNPHKMYLCDKTSNLTVGLCWY
jgi:hypothetical protein